MRGVPCLRSGNKKYRALRLDAGNFSWSSEGVTRKTRVIDVMYCAGNAEHVRTKTLTKGVVIAIDATPFRQYYAAQYASILGAKKGKAVSVTDQAEVDKKRSKHLAVCFCWPQLCIEARALAYMCSFFAGVALGVPRRRYATAERPFPSPLR